jgi:hypothetical protein
VSAVGYFGTRLELQVILGTTKVEIVFQRDPNANHLDGTDRVMSPKARKETRRAVYLLKSGISPKQRNIWKQPIHWPPPVRI